MKRLIALLAGTAAISTFGISAALAATDFVAGVGAGPGQWTSTDYEFGPEEITADAFHIHGLVSGEYNFTPVLGVQGDVLIRLEKLTAYGDEYDTNSLDGVLHAFYRDPERFLLGGLVQVGQDSIQFNDRTPGKVDRAYVGAEAQLFLDQFTLYGQAGRQEMQTDWYSADGWFVTGEVRYFLSPDFKIEAHASYSGLALDTGKATGDTRTFNLGFGAEYKLADLPFSLFGKYDFSPTELNGGAAADIDNHRLLVGIRFNLGEETLLARDRNGVSLKPVEFNAGSMFTGFQDSID